MLMSNVTRLNAIHCKDKRDQPEKLPTWLLAELPFKQLPSA